MRLFVHDNQIETGCIETENMMYRQKYNFSIESNLGAFLNESCGYPDIPLAVIRK